MRKSKINYLFFPHCSCVMRDWEINIHEGALFSIVHIQNGSQALKTGAEKQNMKKALAEGQGSMWEWS